MSPRTRWLLVPGTLVLAITLAACGQSDDRSGASSSTIDTEPSPKKEPTYLEKTTGNVASELDGIGWILVSLYDQGPLSGTNITLNITGDGIEGSTGCNRYASNSVTVSGGELKIRRNSSTKIGCPADIMQQESSYLRALSDAASYQIQGNRLEIQDAAGKTTLVFAAQVR